MSRLITLLCHDRPDTLRRSLAALDRCVGLERWAVLVLADEPGPGVISTVAAWATGGVIRERERVAFESLPREARVSNATFDALALGFARADLVLHLEDDVVLAPDALTFVEWAAETYRADPDVFSISTFNELPGPRPAHDTYAVRKEPGWLSTGWATWRDRWEEMRSGWGWGDQPWIDRNTGKLRPGRPWDDVVYHDIRRGRCHVFPVVSRSQHIGHDGGSPHTPHVEASVFAGDLELPPWHELERAA